jgi:hypothetical protein
MIGQKNGEWGSWQKKTQGSTMGGPIIMNYSIKKFSLHVRTLLSQGLRRYLRRVSVFGISVLLVISVPIVYPLGPL